jgi:AcrR family transcriptional regulator
MTSSTVAPAAGDAVSASAILDAALVLAEQRGWDAVHVYDIAQVLGIGLTDIQRHYGDKDEIAEAWFDRADAALLAQPQTPGWNALTHRQRLHRAICAWLDALAPHRRVTAAMLRYKLQPEHVHLQVLGVMRISRTVQWVREVAGVPSVGWRRETEEAVLTSIYLATFARWLADSSPGAASTRRFLDRWLSLAERAALRLGSGSRRPD